MATGIQRCRNQFVLALVDVVLVVVNHIDDFLVDAQTAQTVTAEHEDVTVFQIVDVCVGNGTVLQIAKAARDDVAVGMVVGILRT